MDALLARAKQALDVTAQQRPAVISYKTKQNKTKQKVQSNLMWRPFLFFFPNGFFYSFPQSPPIQAN